MSSLKHIEINALLEKSAWGIVQETAIRLSALTKWHVANGSFAPILGLGLFGVAAGTAIGRIVGDRIEERLSK